MGRCLQVIASKRKGWLLTVREPPDESSVSRVRVPLAKPRICGATCPSDHHVVQLRENARVQPGRCGFDSHQECQFRRAVEFGLSATVLTDQRVRLLRSTQSLARVSCCARQQFRRVAGLGYRSISARSPVRVRPPATDAGVVQG